MLTLLDLNLGTRSHESKPYNRIAPPYSTSRDSTWTTIWENGGEVADNAWVPVEYDISAVAAGQNQYPLSRLAVHQELDGVTAVCELGPAYVQPLQEFRFDTLFWTNFREDHIEDPEERKQAFEVFRRLMQLSPKAEFYFGKILLFI